MLSQMKLFVTISMLALSISACVSKSPVASDHRSQGLSPQATADFLKNFKQSPLKSTGRSTDWAIDGPGFFEVIDRSTNKKYYTRNGAFQRNSKGELVTSEGYFLEPGITLPDGDSPSFLSEGGSVWLKDPKTSQWTQLGMITLARFEKEENLKKPNSGAGLYEAVAAAGSVYKGQPNQYGIGRTLSGALEDFTQPPVTLPQSGCQYPSAKLQSTGKKTDWLIEGKGYFTFMNPLTGEIFFSRQARLTVNPNGQLVSPHGYYLDPAITLFPVANQANDPVQNFVRIDPDGRIWAKDAEGKETAIGNITVSLVEQPEKLQNIGFTRETVFALSDASQKIEQRVMPGQAGAGKIKMGGFEDCGQDLIARPADFLASTATAGL